MNENIMETHKSYGMLSFSRTSRGADAYLFGMAFGLTILLTSPPVVYLLKIIIEPYKTFQIVSKFVIKRRNNSLKKFGN